MFRALFLAAATAGVAIAAPVPKAAPAPSPKESATFMLGTATSDGQTVKFSYVATTTTVFNGIGARAPIVRPAERTTNYQLARVKVTTADGKELTGDDLTKVLANPTAAVRSTTPFDAEWRKLFADDVVFIEMVRAGGNAVGRPVIGGGGVIRPLPIRPALPVRPARPVQPPAEEEPPVEKPAVEKK